MTNLEKKTQKFSIQ